MAFSLFMSGASGLIIDGGIRDILELKKEGFPIFTRFITPSVGDKDGPGEINVPISCGGVPVQPGDLVVGDANGVVVISPNLAEEVLKNAQNKLDYEVRRMKEIRNGIFVKPDIDKVLADKGVI